MYRHIMVPLDGSELAECVLGHVTDIAKSGQQSKVTLVRVVTPLKFYGTDFEVVIPSQELQKLEQENLANARAYLEKQADLLRQKGIDTQIEVMYGNVVDALTDFADKKKVDLIIIATHGRSGVSRWVWGSVADRILRSARVPVLMVRPIACQTEDAV